MKRLKIFLKIYFLLFKNLLIFLLNTAITGKNNIVRLINIPYNKFIITKVIHLEIVNLA